MFFIVEFPLTGAASATARRSPCGAALARILGPDGSSARGVRAPSPSVLQHADCALPRTLHPQAVNGRTAGQGQDAGRGSQDVLSASPL